MGKNGPFENASGEIQTLTRLGLTMCQAKVFLSLVQNGTSSAKTIADLSGVAREKIYQTVPTLQKLCLVEKILEKPVSFKAVPIKEGLSILVARKDREHNELRRATRELLYNMVKQETLVEAVKVESEFNLIPPNKASLRARTKAIENAQKTIDMATSWKRFLQMMEILKEEFAGAMKRGVKCRFVVYNKRKGNGQSQTLGEFVGSSSFELRSLPNSPKVVMTLIDKKQMFIVTAVNADFLEAPMLWSNAQPLGIMAQDYFDLLWIKAKKIHTE